jgi:DNA-binding transcriptional LysR family regulator
VIEKLELLLYLARERHFGKAAQAAGVAQPTLSSALKSLEDQLGVLIVERGSRFRGFTPEGERILDWARKLTADARAMRQEAADMRRPGMGELRLGVIPTALAVLPRITLPFADRHPQAVLHIQSMTSARILESLENLEIDLGVSYLGEEPLGRYKGLPLYAERYALLTGPGGPFAERETLTWAEAGTASLCQLTPDMQNRRLIDRRLREAGVEPGCTLVANSLLALIAHVGTGRWATIAPVRLAEALDWPGRLRAIPLTDPEVTHEIGLILPARDTHAPLVARFLEEAERRAIGGADRLTEPSH